MQLPQLFRITYDNWLIHSPNSFFIISGILCIVVFYIAVVCLIKFYRAVRHVRRTSYANHIPVRKLLRQSYDKVMNGIEKHMTTPEKRITGFLKNIAKEIFIDA